MVARLRQVVRKEGIIQACRMAGEGGRARKKVVAALGCSEYCVLFPDNDGPPPHATLPNDFLAYWGRQSRANVFHSGRYVTPGARRKCSTSDVLILP